MVLPGQRRPRGVLNAAGGSVGLVNEDAREAVLARWRCFGVSQLAGVACKELFWDSKVCRHILLEIRGEILPSFVDSSLVREPVFWGADPPLVNVAGIRREVSVRRPTYCGEPTAVGEGHADHSGGLRYPRVGIDAVGLLQKNGHLLRTFLSIFSVSSEAEVAFRSKFFKAWLGSEIKVSRLTFGEV